MNKLETLELLNRLIVLKSGLCDRVILETRFQRKIVKKKD